MKNNNNEKSAVDKLDAVNDFEKNDLSDELDRLAQTFREELKKAQADAELSEKIGEIIQGIDEEPEADSAELCACCGERKRDKSCGEDYEYCSECREAMRRYPLGVSSILAVAIAAVLAFVSMTVFLTDFKGYDSFKKAEKASKEHKMNTALSAYDDALNSFEANEIVAKKAYYKSAEAIFSVMPYGVGSVQDITARLATALNNIEAKMPIYGSYNSLSDDAAVYSATVGLVNKIMSDEKYADFDGEDNETYKKIMDEFEALLEQKVTIKHIDGTTSKVDASKSLIKFTECSFAYATRHFTDAEVALRYIEENDPSALWMYAYELGCIELQAGDPAKARRYASALYNLNNESVDSYTLYSTIERMSGNNDKALDWADKGLKVNADSSDLLRMKAASHIVDGKYDEAYSVLNKALGNDGYGVLYFTYAVVLNELQKNDELKSLNATLETSQIPYTDRMNDYFAGKLSAKELFTEGTGDVQ